MAAIDPDRRNRHPRMLTEAEKERVEEFIDQIHYSSRYALTRKQLYFMLHGLTLISDIPITNMNIAMSSYRKT